MLIAKYSRINRAISLFSFAFFSPLHSYNTVAPNNIEIVKSAPITKSTDIPTNFRTERLKVIDELFNQASSLLKKNNFEEAIALYQHAINLDPTCSQAYFNLGVALETKNKLSDAQKAFESAIEHNQNYAKAHLQLAKMLYEQQKLDQCLHHFKEAIRIDPDNIDSHISISRAYCEKQDFASAMHHLNIVKTHKIDNIHVLFDLANALNMANELDASLKLYYEILEKTPNNPSILYNIAYTLKKAGKVAESLPYYNKVLELNPNHNEAHFSLGLAHMMMGDWEKGWEEYEWRFKRSTQETTRRTYKQPDWDGIAPLAGKTIYLTAEQGLGDTFQFIRYARIVKERGATVIVSVQSPLVRILSLCPYIDRVISMQEQPRNFDYYAPLMSLPYILKTRIHNVPTGIPYLYADPKLEQEWKEKLSSDTNFKIGICWQGNSNYSTPFLRAVVAAKSIPLSKFSPLMNIPGVSIYSLQKETGMEQLKDLPTNFNLRTFGNNFDTINGRFMDTAAIIKNLDLVVSIDTSICHFAAALGVPTWNMVPTPPDWRWMFDTPDTPWYPNMRLFRQPVPDDWDSVIATIAQELKEYLNRQKINIPNQQPGNKPSVRTADPETTTPAIAFNMNKNLELELIRIEHKLETLIKNIMSCSNPTLENTTFTESVRSFYLLHEMRSSLRAQLHALT